MALLTFYLHRRQSSFRGCVSLPRLPGYTADEGLKDTADGSEVDVLYGQHWYHHRVRVQLFCSFQI